MNVDPSKMKPWHVYRYDHKEKRWIDEGAINSKERTLKICKKVQS